MSYTVQAMAGFVVALIVLPVDHSLGAVSLHYDISSPDDLRSIEIGETVHFDVSLSGISPGTYDLIYNMVARSTDTSLWGMPFNVIVSSDLTPYYPRYTSMGKVSLVVIEAPVTLTTDFVLSFDITAAARGSSRFEAYGADVFYPLPSGETIFTRRDTIPFTIVPEPDGSVLMVFGLLGIALSRRNRITVAAELVESHLVTIPTV